MNYRVVFSPQSADDLERLFDHILEREPVSPTGDLDIADRAMESMREGCQFLTHNPFSCRMLSDNSFVR